MMDSEVVYSKIDGTESDDCSVNEADYDDPVDELTWEEYTRYHAATSSPQIDARFTVQTYACSKGKCFIFDHKFYEHDRLSVRHGTEYDRWALKKTFLDYGLSVSVYKELKATEITSVLKSFAKKDDDFDFVVVCIMSHGNNQSLEPYDACSYTLKTLYECLQPQNCEKLKGKPKIFIVNACQGKEHTPVVPIGEISEDSVEPSAKFPVTSDFFLIVSTCDNFVSFRRDGSWFMQCLAEVFDKHRRSNLDLVSLMTIVQNRIAVDSKYSGVDEQSKECKQQPVTVSTLRKKFFFPNHR